MPSVAGATASGCTEQLLSSECWQRWVRVRSRAGLARPSLSNQLLVALARPDAAFVAGFKSWLRLGYAVKKGERGIAIEETGEPLVLLKTVFVFDRAQVAPIERLEQAPLEPPCEPLAGDSHAHLIAPMQAFAETLGFTVSFETIDGPAGGWCDQKAKRIVVDAGAPANSRLRTLINKAIHGLGVGYREYGRAPRPAADRCPRHAPHAAADIHQPDAERRRRLPYVQAQVGHRDPKLTLSIYALVVQRRDRSPHARRDSVHATRQHAVHTARSEGRVGPQ